MQLDFPDITVHQDVEALVLHSATPLYTLSSAVVRGAFTQTRAIINRHVDKNYDCSDTIQTPEGDSATGTSTDAGALACTGRASEHVYGGPVTEFGYLVGRCVRECLGMALDAE